MKTIVTHISVDQDAVMSAWLVKRFMPEWKHADLVFVSAGDTWEGKNPDDDSDIIHVDTGLGKYDHHQLSDPEKKTCAAKRVFDELLQNDWIKRKEIEALTRMVEITISIDHFGELYLPEPTADIYDFCMFQIFDGLKASAHTDQQICDIGFSCFDAIFSIMKHKINAVENIKNGYIFESKWGKALAMENNNEEALKIALKSGYKLVIRKSIQNGFLRIKTMPEETYDLTQSVPGTSILQKVWSSTGAQSVKEPLRAYLICQR
jgi:hypothetical protein